MIDKDRAIQTVVEDMGARVRLSAIRKGLQEAGFSPSESHEIISAAIEQRKDQRVQSQGSGLPTAIAVIGLATVILVVTYFMAWSWCVYLVSAGLLSCGAYLCYREPKGRE